MKALKWILVVVAASASVAAVVFAVLRRTDDCCCAVTNLLQRGKATVQPCYERVVAFFNEKDLTDEIGE